MGLRGEPRGWGQCCCGWAIGPGGGGNHNLIRLWSRLSVVPSGAGIPLYGRCPPGGSSAKLLCLCLWGGNHKVWVALLQVANRSAGEIRAMCVRQGSRSADGGSPAWGPSFWGHLVYTLGRGLFYPGPGRGSSTLGWGGSSTLGRGLLYPGPWAPLPWAVGSSTLGRGLLYPAPWAPLPWAVGSSTLGRGLLYPGPWAPLPWAVGRAPLPWAYRSPIGPRARSGPCACSQGSRSADGGSPAWGPSFWGHLLYILGRGLLYPGPGRGSSTLGWGGSSTLGRGLLYPGPWEGLLYPGPTGRQ